MKINIKATGIELTPAITDYINKKFSSIEKHIDKDHSDVLAQVEVGKSTEHHKSGKIFRAEIHLTGGGLDLYNVREEFDLYAAIDLVKDEMVASLTQTKDKSETLTRRGARIFKGLMKGLARFKNFKRRQ